jgi:hypothetical protein
LSSSVAREARREFKSSDSSSRPPAAGTGAGGLALAVGFACPGSY